MELLVSVTAEINMSDLSLFNTGKKSIQMSLASQIKVKKEPV